MKRAVKACSILSTSVSQRHYAYSGFAGRPHRPHYQRGVSTALRRSRIDPSWRLGRHVFRFARNWRHVFRFARNWHFVLSSEPIRNQQQQFGPPSVAVSMDTLTQVSSPKVITCPESISYRSALLRTLLLEVLYT
jgi:hypothetical protein